MNYIYLDELIETKEGLSVRVIKIGEEAFVNLILNDEEFTLISPKRLIELLKKEKKIQKLKRRCWNR